MKVNLNKDSQVIIRGRVCEQKDFWVTVHLNESGLIMEFPLRDVFYIQRQDSLLEQLQDVINIANRTGCYDAADFIKDKIESSGISLRQYNSSYGDKKICNCGHTYYRHFDSYENMKPVGCKYCGCYEFRLSPTLTKEQL